MNYIAIDMGGTQTRIALFDEHQNILDKIVFPTIKEDPKEQVKKISDYINHKKVEHEIKVISICSPGPLDIENGMLLELPNLPEFRNFPIVKMIELLTEIKTYLINDAQAAAIGEASKYDDNSTNVFFTISTGFGAGLVVKGTSYLGENNVAMEIFDSRFNYNMFDGGHEIRTIEQIVSGTHLYNEGVRLGLPINDAKDLFDLYHQGNTIAVYIIEQMILSLSLFVINSSYIIDPTRYIIGGSVFNNNKFLFDLVNEKVNSMIRNDLKGKFPIVASFYGDDAGLIGAYIYGTKRSK